MKKRAFMLGFYISNGLFAAAGFIFVLTKVPETKGKSRVDECRALNVNVLWGQGINIKRLEHPY